MKDDILQLARAKNGSVHCDEAGCRWSEPVEFADVPNWHKKPCPKCGRGEIVSDADMIVFRLAEAVLTVSNDIDPEGKLPRQTYIVNTAPMRTANKQHDTDCTKEAK